MARREGVHHLNTTDLFRDLSREELAALEQRMPRTTVMAGSLIYSPDERSEVLFLLKKGRVRLFRLSLDGKSLTTAIVEPGSIFGEMTLVGQGMQDSFAEALEDCVLYTLNKRDVQDVLLSDPRVAQRLLELVSQRLADTERKLEDFAFKNVPQRLASLLLELANVSSEQCGEPVMVPGRYTHQQLAEMIGTYRETVTKVLNDFRQQGWIQIDRGRVRLLDPGTLQEMASH